NHDWFRVTRACSQTPVTLMLATGTSTLGKLGERLMRKLMLATTALVTAAVCAFAASSADAAQPKGPTGVAKIGHIVVIFAENHSFDEEFGSFPGANGLKGLKPGQYVQRDRDGTVMPMLPPIWGGVIDSHLVNPPNNVQQIPQSATTNMPN